ncbi:bacteriohemerythrin [Neptunomonas antarctica]|uniref:Hemerythrin n=1 Tax=Neptunomonas antarctica TaxID=619304 RepID=A0A1N7L800_9GAMM|nr:bacteriohemerythrin [Neptunomonas antarctica]SIS69968.1 hemerythrin [Neptunomonas antarctica]
MTTVKWTSDLSVGDTRIDDDHKGLFQLVDDLSNANISHDYINLILDRLKRYTIEHFSREEEHMRKVGFPGLKAHLKEHENFNEWLETIRSTYARFPQSPFILGDSVNEYLQGWLRHHILTEDMKYRDYILSQKQDS